MTNLEETLQKRDKRYGGFRNQAAVTQELKDLIKFHVAIRMTPLAADQKEALDMICHKIGRIVCGNPNYADSWHDIAGYAKLVEDRLVEQPTDSPSLPAKSTENEKV